jgi:hypothetical protein
MPDRLFDNWCTMQSATHGPHLRTVLTERSGEQVAAAAVLLGAARLHYEDPTVTADRLARLGYTKTAKIFREYLPTTPRARSGDLGGIVATEYVNRKTPFTIPVLRLRWKDGREMALRGDDLIGIRTSQAGHLVVLKGEVKSAQRISKRL